MSRHRGHQLGQSTAFGDDADGGHVAIFRSSARMDESNGPTAAAAARDLASAAGCAVL
jgi:hypothetical protein